MGRLRLKAGSKLFVIALGAFAFIAMTGCSSSSDSDNGFPIALSDNRIATGAELYAENCAGCHGEPGVSAPPLEGAPPHDETGHTWHHADRMLFEWVLDGPPLAERMPAFRGMLSEEQVLAVLAYIKSRWPEEIQKFQEEGSEQYERQIRESTK